MAHPLRSHQYSELQSRAADLVKKLGGVWREEGSMCRCPAHTDRSPSLSIRVGHSSLLFKCFAGCDTVDVLRAVRRLGFVKNGEQQRSQLPLAAALSGQATADRARELWAESRPLMGTPAEQYLRNRGLEPPFPDLRYHSRTPLGAGRLVTFRPAMIAAVRNTSGIIAVQRTFLDADAPDKARDLAEPRRMLGRPGRGAVRLAPASSILGLAEGIETGLAAMRLHDAPVWALLGNERAGTVELPDTVEHLILLMDNGTAGRRAARKAIEAHARPGRYIETRWPPAHVSDWNDVLLMEEKEGGKRLRTAA